MKLTPCRYNNSQRVRGYPDISANSHNTYFTMYDEWYTIDGGTSVSTPIVGSLITLINEQRIKAGKSTVGFINPVIYANPSALNDIVSGSNPGCSTKGFSAVTGWDPVTGLGTPDYEKLLKVWMALA
jgi:tripeptidyl-peptidase-1